MEIWINPACRTCRTALAGLDAAGVTVIGRDRASVATAIEHETG